MVFVKTLKSDIICKSSDSYESVLLVNLRAMYCCFHYRTYNCKLILVSFYARLCSALDFRFFFFFFFFFFSFFFLVPAI